jgi:hypothetical protein
VGHFGARLLAHPGRRDQTLTIFTIMDNGGCRKKDTSSDVYAALNIRSIWLPPHSNHFLQPLDLVLFAQLKMKSREQQAVKTNPKWLSKVIHIHCSWHECTLRFTVRAAWTAIAIIRTPSEIPRWGINPTSISRKVEEHCTPQPPELPYQEADLRPPPLNTVLHWVAGVRCQTSHREHAVIELTFPCHGVQ